MTKTAYVGGTPITTEKQMRARAEHDFYETSDYTIATYLKHENFEFNNCSVIDPGAGNGIFGKVIRSLYPDVFIAGVEKYIEEPLYSEHYNEWIRKDYIDFEPAFTDSFVQSFNVIIGNPPYKIAEKFFWKSHTLLQHQEHAILIFLLRLGFCESETRYKSMYSQGFKPSKVTVLNTRPSFTGNRKTYPAAFAFFRWDFKYGVADESSKLDFLIYDRS